MDEILSSLRKSGRSAFRTREYAALLGKPAYARVVLHRLKQKGGLLLVRRGWWAFPDAMAEAIACEMSQPAYVSFHSALALHGLTTQQPRAVQLAVARNGRSYVAAGTQVREYRVGRFTGFSRKDGILLASPEKALADCLEHPRACPGIVVEEAIGQADAQKTAQLLGTEAAKRRLRGLLHAKQG